ncbi:MAG: hypothetical protein HQM11_21090 [SAR324 cluster bacterium]|nr:hypothetical protein [SAR324 cluster bacterium]
MNSEQIVAQSPDYKAVRMEALLNMSDITDSSSFSCIRLVDYLYHATTGKMVTNSNDTILPFTMFHEFTEPVEDIIVKPDKKLEINVFPVAWVGDHGRFEEYLVDSNMPYWLVSSMTHMTQRQALEQEPWFDRNTLITNNAEAITAGIFPHAIFKEGVLTWEVPPDASNHEYPFEFTFKHPYMSAPVKAKLNVFVAGPAFRDDFESGNLDQWQTDTEPANPASRVIQEYQTIPALSGQYMTALEMTPYRNISDVIQKTLYVPEDISTLKLELNLLFKTFHRRGTSNPDINSNAPAVNTLRVGIISSESGIKYEWSLPEALCLVNYPDIPPTSDYTLADPAHNTCFDWWQKGWNTAEIPLEKFRGQKILLTLYLYEREPPTLYRQMYATALIDNIRME